MKEGKRITTKKPDIAPAPQINIVKTLGLAPHKAILVVYLKGERHFFVMGERETLLVIDREPTRHDYSVNLYKGPPYRMDWPKNARQFKNSQRDYRWKYARRVVASDLEGKLPDIEDYIASAGPPCPCGQRMDCSSPSCINLY